MSYSIHYGQDPIKFGQPVKKHWGVLAGAVILSLAAIFAWLKPQQVRSLQQRLLPWTQPQVREAFAEFTDRVAEGENVRDALEVFCLEILNEA